MLSASPGVQTIGAPGLMYPAAVAAETPIAVQQRIQSPVGRVPVTAREAPARGRRKRNGRVREGDNVHVPRVDAPRGQAIAGRLDGHALLRMLLSYEPLFLDRRNDLSVYQQRCGGIVTQGARETQNDHRDKHQRKKALS